MNVDYPYTQSYARLGLAFKEGQLDAPDIRLEEFPFESGPVEGYPLAALDEDAEWVENLRFKYRLIKPKDQREASQEFILLLHGLNERRWDKYLPWAEKLCLDTGKAVLLFPLAFHMDRSPKPLFEKSKMFSFYRERKEKTEQDQSSCINAALSSRLEDRPERFFSSGYQTYTDIVALMRLIRAGGHPSIARESKVDIFGYSIGASLGEILLFCDPDGFFRDSRLFAFCGGAVLEASNPLSRAILDSRAAQAILRFFKVVQTEPRGLSAWRRLASPPPERELMYFSSLLGIKAQEAARQTRLAELGDRISALGLKRDRVFPPEGLRITLGDKFTEMDLPFDYSHESPFPCVKEGAFLVDEGFNRVFSVAGRFLA